MCRCLRVVLLSELERDSNQILRLRMVWLLHAFFGTTHEKDKQQSTQSFPSDIKEAREIIVTRRRADSSKQS